MTRSARIAARGFTLALAFAGGLPGSLRAQAEGGDFRFGRGDAVRIVAWEAPEMSGDFEIMSDGRIAHPLLQEIMVAGRRYPEVQVDIVEYMAQFQRTPLVVVTPLVRISVGGAINNPGLVSIDPRAKLIELIGMAGGPSDEARFDYVELVRQGEKTRRRLWDDGAAGQSLHALGLASGDLVVVPARRSVFRDRVVPVAAFLGTVVGIANLAIQISNQ